MTNSVAGHLSNAAMLAYLDGTLPDSEAAAAMTHLASCGRCGRALASLRNFDALARSVPAEKAGTDLVRSIMLRVGISPHQSLFVRAVGALPYVFAMLVVGGILLAVFAWTGTVSTSALSGASGSAAEAYAAVGSAVDQANRSFAGFVSRLLPAVSASGLRLGIGLVLVLMGIAVLDRLLTSRTAQRAR
jgi:anti-sigma factor RsiW